MVRYHKAKKKKKKKSRKHVTIIHIHHSGIIGCQTQNKRTHAHTNKYNDIFHTCRGIIDAVLCSSCLPDIKACIGGFNTKLKKKPKLLGCNVDLD